MEGLSKNRLRKAHKLNGEKNTVVCMSQGTQRSADLSKLLGSTARRLNFFISLDVYIHIKAQKCIIYIHTYSIYAHT